MAKDTSKFKMTTAQRIRRNFSESFKIKKVRELETGITRMAELCRQYEVSGSAVYYWIKKYGIMKDKPERMVIESESDTQELLALRKKIAELEQAVGQKQLLIDFKDKMIEKDRKLWDEVEVLVQQYGANPKVKAK